MVAIALWATGPNFDRGDPAGDRDRRQCVEVWVPSDSGRGGYVLLLRARRGGRPRSVAPRRQVLLGRRAHPTGAMRYSGPRKWPPRVPRVDFVADRARRGREDERGRGAADMLRWGKCGLASLLSRRWARATRRRARRGGIPQRSMRVSSSPSRAYPCSWNRAMWSLKRSSRLRCRSRGISISRRRIRLPAPRMGSGTIIGACAIRGGRFDTHGRSRRGVRRG